MPATLMPEYLAFDVLNCDAGGILTLHELRAEALGDLLQGHVDHLGEPLKHWHCCGTVGSRCLRH